jgi:hypothetical protein
VRRLSLLVATAALATVATARADSQSFTLSTGYNETALTSAFNRGTVFQTQIARGRQLYSGSIDSRGLASIGLGRITSSQDIDCNTSRYPVLTVFGRSGEASGFALDLHQDWYWRGAPMETPRKNLTMFQTQGGIVCRRGEAPKVRVIHRFVTSERRFPGRSQGVEWVWEFRRDYPATYYRAGRQGELRAVVRRSMRAESWAFFSREVGIGVLRVNLGATYKMSARPVAAGDPSATSLDQITPDAGARRAVFMGRLAYEFRRW